MIQFDNEIGRQHFQPLHGSTHFRSITRPIHKKSSDALARAQGLGGAGEAAQGGELQAVLAGFVQRGFDVGVVDVAGEVGEEVVFEVALLAGAGVDVGEVDAEAAEDVEDVDEGAGFVGGGEDDGGFVVAGLFGGLLADGEETGDVGGIVFDVAEEHFEVIELGGEGGTDGGGAFFRGGHLGGFAGGGNRGPLHTGESCGQPLAALVQRFALGVNDFHFFGRAVGEEVGMNGDENLGDDRDAAIFQKRIHRFDDPPYRGIFDRHQTQIRVAAVDFLKNGGNIRDGHMLHRRPELLDARQVGERTLRPEVGDAERFFEGERAGHEFAVDGFEAGVGKRSADGAVGGADAFEDDFFAVGGVDGRAGLVLDFADVDDDAGAGVEEFDDSVIEFIDFAA